MSLHSTKFTPARIRSMSATMTIEQIADKFDVSEQSIANILAEAGANVRAPYLAKCNKTGRTIRAYSERSAYLKVMIAGFSDWTLIHAPTHEQTMQALRQERDHNQKTPRLGKRQDGLGARP